MNGADKVPWTVKQVERFRLEELEGIQRLHAAMCEEAGPAGEFNAVARWRSDMWPVLLGEGGVWRVYIGEELAGFNAWRTLDMTGAAPAVLEVALYVVPGWRGHGVAAALRSAAKADLRKDFPGCRLLTQTQCSNEAMRGVLKHARPVAITYEEEE